MAFDKLPERREVVKEELGLPTFTSLSEALAARPDVVLVATPTSSHVPVALQAAQQGCHLFIEKPLSHNLEGVDDLLALVKSKSLITLVGCNMRFHPGLAFVKKLITDGDIGKIAAARVQVGQWLPDWHPWENYRQSYSAHKDQGGGIILDAIHELDYVCWLMGCPVQQVVCFSGKLSHLEIDTEDTAAVLLRFAGGAMGEVHMDYVQRTYSRSCHIIGDNGTIHWDYTQEQVRWYSTQDCCWHTYSNPPGWEPNRMYLDEMNHFLNCLSGKEEPAMDAFRGKEVLQIALSAKLSAQTGQVLTAGSANG